MQAEEKRKKMKSKIFRNVAVFLVIFILCMFSSHTIGNSFSVQGTPSSIVRLKISKTIKSANTNSIINAQQTQKGQMIVLLSERRQGFGGSSQDDESFLQQNKINKYEQKIELLNKNEINNKPIYQTLAMRQILRI